MEIKNILIVHKENLCNTANETVNTVKLVLNKNNIHYNELCRTKLNKDCVKNNDLIIIVGGDGTVLKVAQFIKDNTLLLSVNSNPKQTEGFFSCCDKDRFEKLLTKLMKDKCKILELNRLKATIDGKEMALALNEYYIGNNDPCGMARYNIKINKNEEYQKSSGVLVSTASGSYAWIKSAGGKELKQESDKFEYLVREPFIARLTPKVKITKGQLKKDTIIEIMSDTNNMIIVADAVGERQPLKKTQRVLITTSNKKIKLVSSKKKGWWS